MTVADYTILISFIVIVALCTWRGLAMTIYSMCSAIVAIVVAYFLRPFVSEALTKMGANEMFSKGIEAQMDAINGGAAEATARDFADKLNLPSFANSFLEKKIPAWNSTQAYNEVRTQFAGSLSEFLVSLLSVVVLILLILLVMMILKKTLKFISKIPVISQINRVGGFAAGILLALIWVSIICAIINLFAASPSFTPITESINNSLFAKYFYNNNILMMLLAKF